jgi:hypothetical protein
MGTAKLLWWQAQVLWGVNRSEGRLRFVSFLFHWIIRCIFAVMLILAEEYILGDCRHCATVAKGRKTMKKILILASFTFLFTLQHAYAQLSWEGEWNGVAGDDRVKEEWRISYFEGKWEVFGNYYWTKKGARAFNKPPGKTAGEFVGLNVQEVGDNRLTFVQDFKDSKPIKGWADHPRIDAQLNGDTIVFKSNWGSGSASGITLIREKCR